MSEFIEITKDGETVSVHPLTLENHKQLGWKVVEEKGVVEKIVDALKTGAPAATPKKKTDGAPAKTTVKTTVTETETPAEDSGE